MSALLDPVITRMDAILNGGRGQNGALGAFAQQNSIPAARFRKHIQHAPLRMFGDEGGEFHRAYFYDWRSKRDNTGPSNLLDGIILKEVRFNLEIGYMSGPGTERFYHPANANDTAAAGVLEPASIAMDDSERIARAFGCEPLFRGNPTTDPDIVDLVQEGDMTVNWIGSGKLVSVTPYKLILAITGAGNYDW